MQLRTRFLKLTADFVRRGYAIPKPFLSREFLLPNRRSKKFAVELFFLAGWVGQNHKNSPKAHIFHLGFTCISLRTATVVACLP